ncbi:hypothetical protein Phum_PHUM603460 [Pediculus humanus corporis]|uniref:Uncharacterized protein n=1 Tax=Pediculus humanus subsp. corporis TaxID=121224 RepID=E0W3E0_PEDHC|nr:uncharacterized protein Phum_PHUM603460 [Pediculus humanus corporis]EEB20146.1 hypothetical protein Phum_PHUM603460 [Pediculus humanus corporis]
MYYASTKRVSFINLCCLTVDKPLNSTLSTNISYIDPHPPDMSTTFICLARGNLTLRVFVIFSLESVFC